MFGQSQTCKSSTATGLGNSLMFNCLAYSLNHWQVLWNPFEDIVPRAKPAEALPSGVATEKKDAKQKATK